MAFNQAPSKPMTPLDGSTQHVCVATTVHRSSKDHLDFHKARVKRNIDETTDLARPMGARPINPLSYTHCRGHYKNALSTLSDRHGRTVCGGVNQSPYA